MTDTAAAITTTGLTKFYGRKLGCSEITLAVPRGSVFGFLGPNGAGKSTFVKMMVGLIAPTSGEAQILGRPVADFTARAKVGLLPENFRYQDWLTPLELLDFHGRLAGMERSQIAEQRPARARARRARRGVRRQDPLVLEGHAAAPRACLRADYRPGAALPRRAHQCA